MLHLLYSRIGKDATIIEQSLLRDRPYRFNHDVAIRIETRFTLWNRNVRGDLSVRPCQRDDDDEFCGATIELVYRNDHCRTGSGLLASFCRAELNLPDFAE